LKISLIIWATALFSNLISLLIAPQIYIRVLKFCFPFLLEAYVTATVLAGAVSVYLYLSKKENPQSYFTYVMKNFLMYVLPLFFSARAYFVLKTESVLLGTDSLLLSKLERPLMSSLFLILHHFPAGTFQMLDFIYERVWFFSHLLVPLVCLSRNRKTVELFYSATSILYVACGLLHLALPVLSPFYVFEKSFSFLPESLSTLSFHNQSWSCQLAIKKGVLDSSCIFQSIRAFPSFHVAYAYLVYLIARNSTRSRIIHSFCLLYFVLIAAGSVILGYHFFSDGLVAVLVVVLWNRLLFRKKS